MNKPNRNDYENKQDYLNALAEYQEELNDESVAIRRDEFEMKNDGKCYVCGNKPCTCPDR